MLRTTIAVLATVAIGTTAIAATSSAPRFRPITSLKVKPSVSVNNAARFRVNPIFARPTMGGFRRPLNRADPLNPQPLPPGPSQSRLNRAGDPLNPQPLPPGPPPQIKLNAPNIGAVRAR